MDADEPTGASQDQINHSPPPTVIDDPLDVSKPRLDVMRALKLRMDNHLSYKQIGDKLGVSKQAVHQALTQFMELVKDPPSTSAYLSRKAELMTAAELKLLTELLDAGKIEKASLNNLAYALRQVFEMRQLTEGKATAIADISLVSSTYAARKAELEAIDAEIIEAGLLPELAEARQDDETQSD